MKLLNTLSILLCIGLASIHVSALAQNADSFNEIRLGPLQLDMTEKRARQLLKSRNFKETSPGDFYRQDGEGRFTRMQYVAEERRLTMVRLYLESRSGYSSALNAYLSKINKALGEPDEHRAGKDQRDPLVYDVYTGKGDDPASLSVQIARGTERFAALMTLQGPSPEQTGTGTVADLDILGFKLGMSQEQMTNLAQSRDMSSFNARNYRSSGSPGVNVSWTIGPTGAQAITVDYSGFGRSDPRTVPQIQPTLKKIDTMLGPDDNGNSVMDKVARYEFSDGDERSAPRLEAWLKPGMANFHLFGDANYQPREMPPLKEIELNPDLVAQAQKAMEAHASMPDPIAIDAASIAGIKLGMTPAQAAAAAQAEGYEQRREDAFNRETDSAYHNVNVKYGSDGVIKVTEQIKPTHGTFDIDTEKQAFLSRYGRPSQAMNESPTQFSGLFREDSDTTRKELNVTVSAYEKYLRIEQRDR